MSAKNRKIFSSDIGDPHRDLTAEEKKAAEIKKIKKGLSDDEVRNFIQKKNLKNISFRKAKKRLAKRRYRQNLPKYKELQISEGDQPRMVVYGRTRIAGQLTFLEAQSKNDSGTYREWLHHCITLTGHEIDGIEAMYIDGNTVNFFGGSFPFPGWATGGTRPDGSSIAYANRVYLDGRTLGSTSQTVNLSGVGQQPTLWDSTHRQRGCAHAWVILVWDSEVFAEGHPNIEFLIRGKKVYDPRSATTVFSNNAALCLADYLIDTSIGLGFDYSMLDENSLIAAANVCDETVTVNAGGSEARYTINGAFDLDLTPSQVIERFEEAMAGNITYVDGTFRFWPGTYRTPVLELTDDDLRSELDIDILGNEDDVFNSVRGVYRDASKDYEETDFPATSVSTYVTTDNEQKIWADLEFPFTVTASMAQRIARIELERSRRQIRVNAYWSLRVLELEPGDNVTLTISRYGWESKVFEVQEVSFGLGTQNEIAVGLLLAEIDSGVFDWNPSIDEQLVNIAPTTTLPNPNLIDAPEGLALESGTSRLYIRSDGTIFSRIYASWTQTQDAYILQGGHVQVQYKKSADSSWNQATPLVGEATFTYILDVQDTVAYDVRVRYVNALGAQSSWTTVSGHMVVGKTEKPTDISSVSGIVDEFGILISWPAITDLDVAGYEVRLGSSWSTSTFLYEGRGTSYRLETQEAGDYTFLVKSKDTSKNYSTNAASTTVSIAVPEYPVVTTALEGVDLVLTWTKPTSLFSIDNYEISYGDTYSGSVSIGNVKGTSFRFKADFGGSRTFWVAARDIANNLGTEGSVTYEIISPSAVVSLRTEVIDNNVLFRWTTPTTHSLPIDHYKLLKGDEYGSATQIGQVTATFSAYIETVGGDFTYWVVPYDSAGNAGTPAATNTIVNDPPDFVILADTDLELEGWYLHNMVIDGDRLVGAVRATESWEDHYIDNSYSTPDDQITAGYPYYVEPTPDNCYAQYTKDYGTTLPPGVIKTGFVQTDIVGSTDLEIRIATSTDGVTWTEQTGAQIYAADSFRYVRIRIIYGDFVELAGQPIGLLLALTYG